VYIERCKHGSVRGLHKPTVEIRQGGVSLLDYSTSGIPDIIVCLNGKFVAFEVKTETGKLTMLQESTLRKINAAKGSAYKVTSLQEVREIIQNLEG